MSPPPMRRPIALRGMQAPRPVLTPYKNDMSFELLTATMVEIRKMYVDFLEGKTAVERALALFESIKKGDRGAPGMPGVNGRNGRGVQPDEVETAVRKFLRQPKDGIAPTVEQVTNAVLSSPKLFKFIQKKIKEIETAEPAETPQPVETIVAMVMEGMKGAIKIDHIVGLEGKLAEIRNHKATGWRGGGDTVVAGVGVTITNTPNGNKQISAPGAGLSVIAIAGTINDSNVAFTALSNPTLLCINGGFYQKTGGSITWTYVAGAITLSSAVGTGGSIFGI